MIAVETRVRTQRDAATAVGEGVPAALMDAAGHGFRVSQEVVASEATDRGTLLQSGFGPEERPDGSVVWGYGAAHAAPIERGTAPFTPPIEPLLEWGRRKLGSRSAGAAVWQKIRREGIDAVGYVARGVDAMRARLQNQGLSGHVKERL